MSSDVPTAGHQRALAVAGRGAGTRTKPGVTCTLTFRWYAENAQGALGGLAARGVFLRYSYNHHWLVTTDFPRHNRASGRRPPSVRQPVTGHRPWSRTARAAAAAASGSRYRPPGSTGRKLLSSS